MIFNTFKIQLSHAEVSAHSSKDNLTVFTVLGWIGLGWISQ